MTATDPAVQAAAEALPWWLSPKDRRECAEAVVAAARPVWAAEVAAAIRAVHAPKDRNPKGNPDIVCKHDGRRWPCPTVRIVEEGR